MRADRMRQRCISWMSPSNFTLLHSLPPLLIRNVTKEVRHSERQKWLHSYLPAIKHFWLNECMIDATNLVRTNLKVAVIVIWRRSLAEMKRRSFPSVEISRKALHPKRRVHKPRTHYPTLPRDSSLCHSTHTFSGLASTIDFTLLYEGVEVITLGFSV